MPPRTNSKTSKLNHASYRRGRYLGLTALLVVLIVSLLVANSQAIYDWYRLQGYTPPATITQLAADDQLTAGAKRVLYVNHPVLENKTDFASVCPNGGKEAAVLGCYVPNQQGIYVLSVNDPTLAGIEQVTAAHELLHAEYDRLDAKTKNQVDGWLMDYYQHSLQDQNIIDQMNAYKKTEPGQLVNEMHSVFGTEVANLPANLENYYKRYFSNRSAITSYYSKYENEFTSRLNQVKQDDAQLAAWKSQINSLEADIKSRQASLADSQQQLNNDRRSGNIAAYNGAVPGYNSQVNAYNAEVEQVHALVQEYNQLVATRNAIALEEQQLVQDISSNAAPISK